MNEFIGEGGQPYFKPSPQQVEELIAAADKHPLGVEFLLDGDLGAVAITFETHAFTVEAARDRLKDSDS
jgi:hypothetical protein